MNGYELLVFDDAVAREWDPFVATRPVGELTFGCVGLRERVERVWNTTCRGYLTSPSLEGFDEPRARPVPPAYGGPQSLPRGRQEPTGRTVLWSSRAVPEVGIPALPASRVRLLVAGEPVGWVLAPDDPLPPDSWLLHPDRAEDGPCVEVEVAAEILSAPWDLLRRNPDRIVRDVEALPDDGRVHDPPAGVHVLGAHTLSLDRTAVIEPGVTVDVRNGPVRLEAGVRIEGPARLVGPLHVGSDTLVFGGSIGSSSVGRTCKIRGEIADSVLLDYVNKAHDGYLGHALVGQWVNLGAFTTNSDLKNNYSPVTVRNAHGPYETGLLKVGCFLGDHVKTGIGTLFNTGTVVGPGSNVFGGEMPPAYVPPFSWGSGSRLTTYRMDAFFESAEHAMERRGVAMTPGIRKILERLWRDGESARSALGSSRTS